MASYGEQLEYAKFYYSVDSEMQLVKYACLNARFFVLCHKRDLKLGRVIFAHKLDSFSLKFKGYWPETEKLPVDLKYLCQYREREIPLVTDMPGVN